MAKSKIKVNENNEFHEDDGDIEQDMKTLGQVRDDLLNVYLTTTDLQSKLSIVNALKTVIEAREYAEDFLLRVMGAFKNQEDEYCEGCPECSPGMHNNPIDPTDSN